MELVADLRELRSLLGGARAARRRVGLVPTLGALHPGHVSLIERAARRDDLVVVSVFVNPLQFGDPADFARYPRDLDGDVRVAERAGAHVVFAPSEQAMVPDGRATVTVDPGPLGDELEGASRPGHFRGVATIVTKLFAIVSPDAAYFGQKDFQQLSIVRLLVDELSFGIEIVDCPTVRELDGLAISSRNRRLTPAERTLAPMLHDALEEGRAELLRGASAREAERAMAALVQRERAFDLDYAVVRDAATLAVPSAGSGPLRLLIAARLGGVRLIDNVAATDDGARVD